MSSIIRLLLATECEYIVQEPPAQAREGKKSCLIIIVIKLKLSLNQNLFLYPLHISLEIFYQIEGSSSVILLHLEGTLWMLFRTC